MAGLLMSLREQNVGLFNNTEPVQLKRANGRVNGVRLHKPDGSEHQVEVRRGVVLACGGFASSEPAQQHYYQHVKRGMRHASLGAESNQGDGHRIAREIGAKLSTNAAEPAAWAPVSLLRLEDGSTVACPHLMERGKPGIIVVDESGNRFRNEAICYHRFVKALIEPERVGSGKAWILCDHRALRAYGVGGVPPFPARISPYLKRGYLVRAVSLKQLADRLDIDAEGLLTTVQRFNRMAEDGEDLDFGLHTLVLESRQSTPRLCIPDRSTVTLTRASRSMGLTFWVTPLGSTKEVKVVQPAGEDDVPLPDGKCVRVEADDHKIELTIELKRQR